MVYVKKRQKRVPHDEFLQKQKTSPLRRVFRSAFERSRFKM